MEKSFGGVNKKWRIIIHGKRKWESDGKVDGGKLRTKDS